MIQVDDEIRLDFNDTQEGPKLIPNSDHKDSKHIDMKYFEEFLKYERHRNHEEAMQDYATYASYGEKIRSQYKQVLSKIFLNKVEGISEELQKDLSKDDGQPILKRQQIRKVDTEHSEMFEKVSVAPYTLEKIRKKQNSTERPNTSHNKSVSRIGNRSFVRRECKLKSDNSTSLLNERSKPIKGKPKSKFNAYSYQNSDRSFDKIDKASTLSHKPRIREKSAKVNQSGKRLHNTSISIARSEHEHERIPKVFKDMNIYELMRHMHGILNLYDKNEQLGTGIVLHYLITIRSHSRGI